MDSTTLPATGRILALDWGERRIGIALSDELQLLSSPLATVTRREGKRFPMPILLGHVEAHHPVGIVVGLPLTLEGDEGESAGFARQLGTLMAQRAHLPVVYWDERMSTAHALRVIREQGGSTRGRKDEVDALAASVLLQGFLDSRRGGGDRRVSDSSASSGR
jgi:putative Holliday junction resolvase